VYSHLRKEKAAQEQRHEQLVPALNELLSEHGLSLHRDDSGVGMSIRPAHPESTGVARQSPQRRSMPSEPASTSHRRSQSPTRRQPLVDQSPPIPFAPFQPATGLTPVRFDYDSPLRATPRRSSHVISESPQGSHGTLVLGRSGRSRYLGPTAGPEWLKHVGESQSNVANSSRTIRTRLRR
jgi:hypothetical protein